MKALRGLCAGADVWVIGSGPSLDYLDSTFFDGRITIGLNLVPLVWRKTTFAVTKYHEIARRVGDALPDTTVLVSRHLHGNRDERTAADLPPNVVVFDHPHNEGDEFAVSSHWPADPDSLVVSWSTITSAMHAAAYLGAANVILVGHDCGPIDGRGHVAGYPEPVNTGQWAPEPDESAWLRRIERDSLAVRDVLRERYGCRVLSLSPFLSPNLDGHAYR